MLKDISSLLLHLIWPERCVVCGRVGVSHCDECLASSVDPLPPFCLECDGRFGSDCCDDPVPLYAAAPHDGYARDFLLALKYRGAKDLGVPIGRLMAKSLPSADVDVILPVPLHKGSPRCYNQTELISRGMSVALNVPYDPRALEWNIRTGTQTGKRGRERMALPLNAFKASESLKGRRVVLVDDVYTTGGTLRAARHAVEAAEGKVAAAYVWTRRIASGESPDAFDEDLI